MKKIILLLMFMPFLMASTCDNDDDQIFCTLEFVHGLNVTVLDSQTNQPLVDGVVVKATDGSYQEFLSGLENLFIGAGERAGTYTITVTKTGYQTYTSAPIRVTADVCHVIPQLVTVSLVSN